MKQIYKISYPTGKIDIGEDSVGSYRYFGRPNMELVNQDFMGLPENIRKDYTVRNKILLESNDATERELSKKEVEFIRKFDSKNTAKGYNQGLKFSPKE